MISTALIVSILLSTQSGIMAGTERQQFSRCLRAFVDAKRQEGMAADAFDNAIASQCTQQETAYRTAYIAAAVRAGDSRSAAERDATLEVNDLRDNYRGMFRGSDAD